MASGMGVRGTMGRCYGFFADYKQCQSDTAAALRKYGDDATTIDTENPIGGCIAMREDYFECLHGRKENARIKAVMTELKKQEYEAKHGVAAGSH